MFEFTPANYKLWKAIILVPRFVDGEQFHIKDLFRSAKIDYSVTHTVRLLRELVVNGALEVKTIRPNKKYSLTLQGKEQAKLTLNSINYLRKQNDQKRTHHNYSSSV